MTDASHELALCLINENTQRFPYKTRVQYARFTRRRAALERWQVLTEDYALHYERTHGDGTEIFTVSDILLAAAEVAEYYHEHIKELTD